MKTTQAHPYTLWAILYTSFHFFLFFFFSSFNIWRQSDRQTFVPTDIFSNSQGFSLKRERTCCLHNLLRSTLGERVLFVSLLSGCYVISGFGRHLGLSYESFESCCLIQVPQVDLALVWMPSDLTFNSQEWWICKISLSIQYPAGNDKLIG